MQNVPPKGLLSTNAPNSCCRCCLARGKKLVVKTAVAPAAGAARPLSLYRSRAAFVSVSASAAPEGDGDDGDDDGDDDKEYERRPSEARELPGGRLPHAVLGVPPSASAAEARQAWRARALQIHPDVLSDNDGGVGEAELLELNMAYAAFLKLRGVRARGAVGKEGEEGGGGEEEGFDDDDDPFLPPLFSDDSDAEEGASFIFVDPFSIPNFDFFRWRELQDLARGEGAAGGGGGTGTRNALPLLTLETAADVALAFLARAGVTRVPPRSAVALLTERQLSALGEIVESSLEKMDFAAGAYAVSEALARARVANSGWRRRRRQRKKTTEDGG